MKQPTDSLKEHFLMKIMETQKDQFSVLLSQV